MTIESDETTIAHPPVGATVPGRFAGAMAGGAAGLILVQMGWIFAGMDYTINAAVSGNAGVIDSCASSSPRARVNCRNSAAWARRGSPSPSSSQRFSPITMRASSCGQDARQAP